MHDSKKLSIVIPAKNEAKSLNILLPKLRNIFPSDEIIVVNDASNDNTIEICNKNNVDVITHPYNMGNGAAIKTGARHAIGEILVFMDADGQHEPDDISKLIEKVAMGYDMVVGARKASSQANIGRSIANRFYNKLASLIVGFQVEDLTSGFRAVVREKFLEFLHLLPNGFSYPTTITMAFFRTGYPVSYIPIVAKDREGTSHIRIVRDGLKFLLIIFKVGTLYSPLKIFIPVGVLHLLTGFSYYGYTYITEGRFTNMSALFIISGIIIALIGLVSEQITSLHYINQNNRRD